MFADAHRLATESFERRLQQELSSFRLEITQQLSALRVDIIKWSFLFWLGQVAVILSVLSVVLRAD